MTGAEDYIDRAYCAEKRAIIHQQWQDAISSGTIVCGCGLRRALPVAYRCLYCGQYFCSACAEKHFGQTVLEWINSKRIEQRKQLEASIPMKINKLRLFKTRRKAASQPAQSQSRKSKVSGSNSGRRTRQHKSATSKYRQWIIAK